MGTEKGFQMSISAMISVVLGALFIAAIWFAASGFFESGTNQAMTLMEGLTP